MSEEEINKEEFSAENIRELKNVFLLGAISEFGRRKLTKYINYLEDELQSYKDKEDKLRELCENVRQHDWEAYDVSLEVLEIIEGDK